MTACPATLNAVTENMQVAGFIIALAIAVALLGWLSELQ